MRVGLNCDKSHAFDGARTLGRFWKCVNKKTCWQQYPWVLIVLLRIIHTCHARPISVLHATIIGRR